MWDAMEEAAVNIRGTDTIIMITDGGPSDGKFLLPKNFVPEWIRFNKYRRVMLYTIVVDKARKWLPLMRKLVEATHGFYLNVTADPNPKKKKKKKRGKQ